MINPSGTRVLYFRCNHSASSRPRKCGVHEVIEVRNNSNAKLKTICLSAEHIGGGLDKHLHKTFTIPIPKKDTGLSVQPLQEDEPSEQEYADLLRRVSLSMFKKSSN